MLHGRPLTGIAAAAVTVLALVASASPAAAQAQAASCSPNGATAPGTVATSGQTLLCVSGTWQYAGLYLGTTVTGANPLISGDATTGFYTAGAGLVDVTISGVKTVEWTSVGQTVTGTATANSFIPTSSTVPVNGMYLPAANSLGFSTSGSVALTITSTGSVGVGTTSPAGKLSVQLPSTTTSYGIYVNMASTTTNSTNFGLYETGTLSNPSTGTVYGAYINPSFNSFTNTLANLYGLEAVPIDSAGTVTNVYGIYSQPQLATNSTVTLMVGDYAQPENVANGTVTTLYGVYAQPQNTSNGTVTTMYGLLAQPKNTGNTGTAVTGMYGVAATPVSSGSNPGFTDVTSMYGLYAQCQNSNSRTSIGTCYELYLDTPTKATTTSYTNTPFGVYQADSASINYFAGNVGIGTASPTGLLSVYAPSSTANANVYGLYEAGALSVTDTSGVFYGAYINPTLSHTTTVSSSAGIYSLPQNTSSGVVSNMWGVRSIPQNTGNGSISTLMGVAGVPEQLGSGTVGASYALYGRCDSTSTGITTTCYSAYLDTPLTATSTSITNRYGLYQADSSATNYFAGAVGIGTTDPTFGGVVGSSFTIVSSGTAMAAAYSTTQLAFAINPAATGAWTMFDRAASGGTAWTAGITQSGGNVGIGTTGPFTSLDVERSIVGGAPATSGTSDPNTVMRIGANGNVALDYGWLVNGVSWIQNRAPSNFANDFGLVLEPNGGNVGIGTTGPATKLVIAGTNGSAFFDPSSGTGVNLALNNTATNGRQWSFRTNTAAGRLDIRDDAAGVERMTFDSAGNVGIGTTGPDNTLSVNGSADKASGGTTWGTFSDIRLKDVEGPYTRGLADIVKLNPIRFHYKKNNPRHLPTANEEFGVIAQDVQKVFPETITTARDGYLQFNMSPVNFAMINAVKELKAEDDALLAQVKQLKTANDNLQHEMSELQTKIGAVRK